jgi:hypothetical protein
MPIETTIPALHPKQIEMAKNRRRFNYASIGRQFGKTSFLEYGVCMQALQPNKSIGLFYPSPTEYTPVWENLKRYLEPLIRKKDETKKYIDLINGTKIELFSTHKKDKGRGRHFHSVWVDEAEMHQDLQYSIEYVIHATLLRYQADMWVLSSPKGFRYFQTFWNKPSPNNAYFNYSTYDNPFIPTSEIDLAKERLPEDIFRQEYLGEFVLSSNRFAYEFKNEKHVGTCEYNPNLPIIISFDFNIDPITAVAVQHLGGTINVLNEFRILNGTLPQICAAIKAKYPDAWRLEVTGDPAGYNRQIVSMDARAYYREIQAHLGIRKEQIKAARAQSTHKSSRLILNTILRSFPSFTISPNCKFLIEDMNYVQSDADSHIIKEKTGEGKLKTHLLDCLINYLHTYHSNFVPRILIK